MKSIRTRVIVALAGSAVLASGLSVVAAAATSAGSGPVAVADGTLSGTTASPNITIYDG
jgi:hypothetical protein